MFIKNKMIVLLMLALNGYGLEFGSMGQVSMGMGGAGVALKDSAWGLYYNPALLGADRRGKFGYSFGVQIKEQNLLELASIDVDNLKNLPQTLTNQLTSPNVGGKSVTIDGKSVNGALGGMLDALFPDSGGNITKDNVQTLVTEITGSSQTCTDISTCWDFIKDPQAQNKLKDKLTSAAAEGGSPLVGAVISGIDPNKITELAKEATGGNFDAETLFEKVGEITLAKGSDSSIDRLLNDFETINNALKANDLNVVSQNGFVIQIPGSKTSRRIESDEIGSIDIQDIDSGRGAIGVGVFASAFSNASAQIDPNNNQLIFDLGGKYYDVSVNGNAITLKYNASKTNLDGSIMNENANHLLYANALALIEVPIGYGHTLFTPAGDVNIGIALKFIQAMGYGQKLNFSVGKFPSISFDKNDVDMSQTFGVDLGVLYSPNLLENLHIGLVLKNINAPVIKRTNVDDVTLNRQLRAGVSYVLKDFLTFAFDADLLPNNTLSLQSPKSQFIGGGVMANFKKVDFRLGAMQDMRSNAREGMILTGGINLLGFLDVALQYGLGRNFTIEGINISNYMNVHIGGQFSF
ncbi:conjugal transfer protein TraF [Helicobacter marmotae]|nr:conjugal transfer protein TraF [Helicobacter marmotae]